MPVEKEKKSLLLVVGVDIIPALARLNEAGGSQVLGHPKLHGETMS